MAKPKHKPQSSITGTPQHQRKQQQHQQQQQGDSKKRKMQQFQRVSISSNQNQSQSQQNKKRKFSSDGNQSQGQQQRQLAWKNKTGAKNNHHQQELHQRPVIPFRRKDRILLIGEGDFSFARSLFEHHRCKNVFATCYDSNDTLSSKYQGQAEENIKTFLNYNDDEDEEETGKAEDNNDDDNDNDTESQLKREKKSKSHHHRTRKVFYSIDARKLGASVVGGGKEIRKGIPKKRPSRSRNDFSNRDKGGKGEEDTNDGPWDIVSFNFPHVGGLSTDVNRQVRANQELLVAFFKACVPLLSSESVVDDDNGDNDDDEYGYGYSTDSEETSTSSESEREELDQSETRRIPRNSGQIIVTIFEGEPYTLWNIKDLARHAGLQVVTSFRFPWKSYPGYSHARTLGIVESRDNNKKENTDSEGGGGRRGWKGEDREARSYVFEVKRDSSSSQRQQRHGVKKNKRDDVSSDED